jgi:DNA-binding MarR family transcriptional regulator
MRTCRDVTSRLQARDVTLMFGVHPGQKREREKSVDENIDVARLFFDAFSKRVGTVEDGLKTMSSEIERLKISVDRSQLSDLVLLERLQKAEGLVRESISWMRQAVEVSKQIKEAPAAMEGRAITGLESSMGRVSVDSEEAVLSRSVLPSGRELGSLPSITTATELQVLTMLANEGPKSAPEIGQAVGRSREHTARLMKKLYEEGYVRRDQTRIPFRYSLVERVKQTFKKQEAKDGEKEAISVPQT